MRTGKTERGHNKKQGEDMKIKERKDRHRT